MKKLLLSSLAVAALAMGSSAIAATSTTTSFNVTVTLTSTCRAGLIGGNAGVAFGGYTAFQATPIAAVVGPTYSVDCTRNLAAAPTAIFDAVNGTTTASVAGVATANGVVAGLNYKLTSTAQTAVAGTAATAAASGQAAGGNGTATNYAFKITGDMPEDQAGSVLNVGVEALSATTQSRSLIISF